MKTFFIFFMGMLLGSTLGFGGMWYQVVQPAMQEVQTLEDENGVLTDALNGAVETLREEANRLRGEGSEGPVVNSLGGDSAGGSKSSASRLDDLAAHKSKPAEQLDAAFNRRHRAGRRGLRCGCGGDRGDVRVG